MPGNLLSNLFLLIIFDNTVNQTSSKGEPHDSDKNNFLNSHFTFLRFVFYHLIYHSRRIFQEIRRFLDDFLARYLHLLNTAAFKIVFLRNHILTSAEFYV